MKEVRIHSKHLGVTFSALMALLFPEAEVNAIGSLKEDAASLFSSRTAWIKTSDLAIEGITTEKMALLHLLWFQSIGRVVIEDIDPISGAVLIHLSFKDIEKDMERVKRS